MQRGGADLVYTVQDRSLLLPLYKRLVVSPSLRLVPHGVDPNHITHVGHVLNLLGVLILLVCTLPASIPSPSASPARWPYLAAIAFLQLYNWCDNVDGAHARRTGRTSALGELLDHGLDMLNTTYIAFVAAAAVGAPPVWWTALAIVVPAACAATYWEQAETGLFSLGLLNQVESVMVLSLVLLVTAIAGVEVWDRIRLGPVTARLAITGWVTAQAALGIVRNVVRVTRLRGGAAVLRIAPLFAFDLLVIGAGAVGALSPPACVVVGTAGNVFFGLRSLAARTAGRAPRVEAGVVGFASALAVLVGARVAGSLGGPSRTIDVAFATLAALFFGAYALLDARAAHREVSRIDLEKASLPKVAQAPARP